MSSQNPLIEKISTELSRLHVEVRACSHIPDKQIILEVYSDIKRALAGLQAVNTGEPGSDERLRQLEHFIAKLSFDVNMNLMSNGEDGSSNSISTSVYAFTPKSRKIVPEKEEDGKEVVMTYVIGSENLSHSSHVSVSVPRLSLAHLYELADLLSLNSEPYPFMNLKILHALQTHVRSLQISLAAIISPVLPVM
ncbi:hypothetical protein B7463_g1245, partial [Scytalidium lignicola]